MNAIAPAARPAVAGLAPKISVRGVFKTFTRRKQTTPVVALKDINLDVADNTFVTLVGPSGCGKTTLLRVLNGLIRPDAGEVLVGGIPPVPGPSMGFVFQSFRLIPWLTVQGNVAFSLEVAGIPKAEARARAEAYLGIVGLTRFRDAYPNELSGGMKQRVALARALVGEPQILLMDEPFASLDAQTREFMQLELLRLWSRQHGVVVFVTHSVDEAVLLADKVVLMGPRPGRIVETIDIKLPRPRDFDMRSRPEFIELRTYLWDRVRTMVMNDPESDFFHRDEERPAISASAAPHD